MHVEFFAIFIFGDLCNFCDLFFVFFLLLTHVMNLQVYDINKQNKTKQNKTKLAIYNVILVLVEKVMNED